MQNTTPHPSQTHPRPPARRQSSCAQTPPRVERPTRGGRRTILRNASLPRENSVCRALSMRSKSCHAGGVHCSGHADGTRRATRRAARHAYNATWPAAQTARCDARDGVARIRHAMKIATTLRQPHNCTARTNEETNKQPIKVAAKQTHTQTHTQAHTQAHTHTEAKKQTNEHTGPHVMRTTASRHRCSGARCGHALHWRWGATEPTATATCGVGCQYSVSLGTCASVPGGPGERLGRLK